MYDTNDVKLKMDAIVEHFKEEMKKVRTGRAHPDMLANVKVEVYGQFSPLNQVSNITISGGSMLQITPYCKDLCCNPRRSDARSKPKR